MRSSRTSSVHGTRTASRSIRRLCDQLDSYNGRIAKRRSDRAWFSFLFFFFFFFSFSISRLRIDRSEGKLAKLASSKEISLILKGDVDVFSVKFLKWKGKWCCEREREREEEGFKFPLNFLLISSSSKSNHVLDRETTSSISLSNFPSIWKRKIEMFERFLTASLETVSCNPLDQETKILSSHDPTTFIETAVDQSLTKHDTLYLSFNTFEGEGWLAFHRPRGSSCVFETRPWEVTARRSWKENFNLNIRVERVGESYETRRLK